MKIEILTLFPQMFENFLNESMIRIAIKQKAITVNVTNIRDFAIDKSTETVSALSAPHFQNLFRTFTDFKLITRNQAIWQMEDSMILFNNFNLDDNSLYLLTLAKNEENITKKFEKNFPKFKERIKLLIQTYL